MMACHCPGCGSPVSAEDALAGQTTKCPACGVPVHDPARLDRQCRYLICDAHGATAVWQNDGRGWMLSVDAGLISAMRNPDQIPSEGDFRLVELKPKLTDAGLRIEDIAVYQLAERWALTGLARKRRPILDGCYRPGRPPSARRRTPSATPFTTSTCVRSGSVPMRDGLPVRRRLPLARHAVRRHRELWELLFGPGPRKRNCLEKDSCSDTSARAERIWAGSGQSTRTCVRREMTEQDEQVRPASAYYGSTIAAAAIVLLFYPMTIAPVGALSNGGALGLGSLVIAAGFAWRAFMLNRVDRWLRRYVQLPITACVTYMAIADAIAQYRAGHWLWF